MHINAGGLMREGGCNCRILRYMHAQGKIIDIVYTYFFKCVYNVHNIHVGIFSLGCNVV